MKAYEYDIISYTDQKTFITVMNEAGQNGWALHGPTTILQTPGGSILMYLQPIVRETYQRGP
jgi:hypothetical protein